MGGGRNERFLNNAFGAALREASQQGFHGEVSVRLKVQGGVIQSGTLEKATPDSPSGNRVTIEKTRLPG